MAKTLLTSKDKVPMRVYLGVKNNWTITIKDNNKVVKDVSLYAYFCQIRDKPNGKLLATLTIDNANQALGIVGISLTKANSELIGMGSGVFDVLQQEIADTTNTIRLYGGEVLFIPVATVI